MYILIAYDVNTTTPEGAKRLRKVAKFCQNYGQRVQNSVFQCKIEAYMLPQIQRRLELLINMEQDNILIYKFGTEINTKVISIGKGRGFDMDAPIII